MTVNQIINRLTANATEFLLAGELAKSNACMELLATIKIKGLDNIQGKILVDNL